MTSRSRASTTFVHTKHMALVISTLLSSALALTATRSAYDFSSRDLRTGKIVELSEYRGGVSLVVNVASR